MCIAIPGKITSIEGHFAWVNTMGVETKVNIDLIEDPTMGDFILIHTGFAIEKIDYDKFNRVNDDLIELINQDDLYE